MQTQKVKKIPQIITSIKRDDAKNYQPIKNMNNFIKKIEFSEGCKRQHTARFLKRKNKIQKNKQNIDYGHQLSNSTRNTLTEDHYTKTNKQERKRTFRQTFIPKKQAQILNKYQIQLFSKGMKQDINIIQEKQSLKNLLLKNKLMKNRCLIGINIPTIQQKYSFSRYDLYNLYAYYKSLLKFSNRSLGQFKKGFQTILNINTISLNSQMVDKCFQMFSKDISFNKFVYIYGNIQTLLFTQTVIDIISSIFSKYYRQEYITYEQFSDILKQKIEQQDSLQITKYVWEKMCRQVYEKIQIQQIFQLCHQDISLCRNLFKTINKNKKN